MEKRASSPLDTQFPYGVPTGPNERLRTYAVHTRVGHVLRSRQSSWSAKTLSEEIDPTTKLWTRISRLSPVEQERSGTPTRWRWRIVDNGTKDCRSPHLRDCS